MPRNITYTLWQPADTYVIYLACPSVRTMRDCLKRDFKGVGEGLARWGIRWVGAERGDGVGAWVGTSTIKLCCLAARC